MEKNRIDSEYLIDTIKKYESIWNKNSKEYNQKSLKESAWNQVCEELHDQWNTLGEDEKLGKQSELKKRWNNIRDYYKKDLALQLNGSIGQPSMKRKKYVYSSKLDFLRPVLDRSYNRERGSDDDLEEQEIYIEETLYSSDSETTFTPKRKTKHLEDKKILEVTPMKLEIETNQPNQIDENDCDLMFLKSLVTDMKMMNRMQKLDFKMGILQLYKSIMNENLDGNEYENEDSKNPLK